MKNYPIFTTLSKQIFVLIAVLCINMIELRAQVNLSVSSNTGTEAAQTSITATATASAPVSGAQTVTLTVSGTNITTGDYTLNTLTTNSVTITIPNGMTTGTATFKVVDDIAVEVTETATLTISSPSAGITLGATTTQDITITDNNDMYANLALVKTVNDNTPSQNQVITFTLVVSNALGSGTANSVTVTDVVPAGMTFLPGSQTGDGTYDSSNPSTTGLKWQNITILNGGTKVLTFQATVTAAGGTSITNFAEVTSSSQADPNSTPNNGNIGEDDGDIETITVSPTVNLSVSTNTATEAPATVVTVTATASAAVSGNQTVALAVTGTGINAGDYNLSNTTITIPSGQTTGSVTFTVVDDALVEGAETATLTISNPSFGITLGTTTTQNIAITDNDFLTADLALVKTVNDNTPDQNQVITFTLVVSNSGPNPATAVTVTDVVPAGMTFVMGSQTGPGTYLSTNPSVTGVNWQNLFIANGGSVVLTFQATVTAAGGSSITNFAQVTSSAELDPDSTPNNGNIGEDDGDSETVTVNVANPPVVLICPTNTTTASCQTQAAVNIAFATWLATVSGTGGCSGVLTNNNMGAPLACGGSTTVTFTYTSTCAPLTTTCQATFTVSAPANPTPVFAGCSNNTISLGCNPGTLPSCSGIEAGGFGGTPTASNSCGSVPVNCSAGSITINGCNRTQVFTFEATACGQTVTCTRTFTWTVVTPPSFNGTCGNGVINLGCNPATLPSCDPNVTASNECGPVAVTCNIGAITSNGCNRSQQLTYTANAVGCGTFSTCIKIYNWQVTTAPVFANCDNTIDLGCNPATLPSCANISQAAFGGAITATNECGNVSMSCTPGAITSNGCNRTQVFTITATACGLTSTCTRTFNWTVVTAPVFANCTSGTTDLGCNPSTLPSCDAGVTASNECSAVTVVCTPGSITSNGCDRSQVFTYVATACGLSSTCTRTFTWQVGTVPVLTCPTNVTTAVCQTQTAVDAAFNAWLATASFTGGCGGVLTNNNTGAPSSCGGSATVTFTLNSNCQSPQTCQATFTVPTTPTVVLTCPTNTTAAANQTQTAVNMAFSTWLSTVSASGGCNGALSNNNVGAPPATGGSATVTFTYTSDCAPLTTTCQATFTVAAAAPVVLTCPTNTTTAACQTQATVDAAFATWLATATASGGCNGMLTNNSTGAPAACGGSTTVTFTYTSTCAPLTTTCQATFTVTAAPTVVLTCPTNTTVAACQTQASVDAAFATWLATASASGGCNGALTNNSTGAPAACGGSTTVTFTYTSDCAPLTTTCQATFTVTAAPTVVLTCPTNTTVAACQTQAAVDAAFATWLATASASGGCNGVLTNNNMGAPLACGGSTTVTFTYTSTCAPTTTTCTATFTVPTAPTVVLNCPTNTTVAACQTQAEVNTAFATWLATATVSGGCNGVLTNDNTGAPSACGGSTTVTFTYTSSCGNPTTTCQATFTVTTAPTITLTCPTNQTQTPGQTQAAVNAAFASWLATAAASGSCNGVLTNNNTGAPSATGGTTTVTFTYTGTCDPLTTTCQASFTVPSPITLTCPTNTTAAACQTQAAVNTAFATWLATASASGGCNGVLTNNNMGAPLACGGSTTVTFTYTSTCAPTTTTCTATFTVPAPPTVSLTCPTNTTVAACQTQAAVNTAFATWLATATASGGCNAVLTNNNMGAPLACGGSTTVTFTYTSTCAPTTTTCTATFTVPAAPTVSLTCPTNTTVAACQTQAAVDAAFATWLATASASGGCNGILTNNSTGAPAACGGSTTVTFTYTSDCAPTTTTCQATFTVPAAPTVVLTCPTNTTVAACQTQAAVDAAFATWLATASASGGCNGALTNNSTGAPAACGGSTTVTFTYTSTCAPTTTTCTATFTVPAAPTVVLTCPSNTTVAACQTQAAVDAAFATWLATASASGGCNGMLTNNSISAPAACGGSTTVTFTYTSDCAPTTTTCTATFTVPAAPTVVLTCPSNTTVAACQTQAAVDAAFATWLATASASGSCNGMLTNNSISAPAACGGSTTVTFTYTSDCAPTTTTCTATFTVPAAPTVVLTCPTNTTVAACQTQAAVDAAFATWLATASASGGCNGMLTNNSTGAPAACGGSTTVTFTYTSDCAPTTTTCQATFTVAVAPTIVLTCPTNQTEAFGQTQTAVNTAFATWLATASASGGCNGVLTNNNTGAPAATGATTTVTFTYTSNCAPTTTTCQATFTVPAAPTVVLTCPTNTTVAACQTQAAVDAAFATWLATASASGGCNGMLTNNSTGAPAACGGSTTVTFTYTSDCAPTTTTCTATFTVDAVPSAILICPVNTTAPIGQTQAQVNAAFASWLATATASGGCNGVLTNNNTGAPSACGGSTTVTFIYTSFCAAATTTCQATFTVPSANISGSATVCQNSPTPVVTFTANGGTPPYTFTYQINGGANQSISTMSNSTTVNQSTAISGTFVYTLLADSQCNQNNTVTIHVLTKPTISLNVQNQVMNEGNSQVFCDNDANPANPLQFTITNSCVVGTPLWRIQIDNGNWSDWSTNAPSSQPSDNTTYRYQAACDVNCLSTYTTAIALTINYRASAPQNVSLVADATTVAAGESKSICNIEGNTITFNATCAPGEIVLYSVDGADYSNAIPSQIVDGNFHNYRVRCRKADGTSSCVETESAVMSLKISPIAAAPTASISPTSGCGTPTAFSGNATCGSLTTIWYNAATNQLLPTLPAQTPNATTSYYARCQTAVSVGETGCLSEKSNIVTFTLTPVNEAPIVTASAEVVCTSTVVTVSANCPAGSTAFWNTGVTTNSFQVAFSNITQQTYWAKCIFTNGCQSSESSHKTITWKAFELTLINIGQSKSGIKPVNDKAAWASQFITADAGPSLDLSTEANPTLYYTENTNKTGPRYWTIQVETCALGTNGSVTYDMLASPEAGVKQSFNTHENNAPYFMYANREGFTELYAQNHPAYGFYQDNGSGGNVYDAGLPKGLYKLSIRYWDQKGQGSIYPSTRQPAGNILAYQEYWFRIQSKDGIGVGSARATAATDNAQRITDNGSFAQVMPNPVSNTLRLKVNDAKDQKVNVSLVDASGRTLLQRVFVPQTNQHQEEFEVSELANGMYFLRVDTVEKHATIKVIKVQ